eukprot:ctg_2642.g450
MSERWVLDAGAFIQGADSFFHQFITAAAPSRLYTVPDVIREVRDDQARRRLALLRAPRPTADGGVAPDHHSLLVVREPGQGVLAEVVRAARDSGDYASLSLADLRVLALALQVQRELNADHAEHSRASTTTAATGRRPAVPAPDAHLTDWRREDTARSGGLFYPSDYRFGQGLAGVDAQLRKLSIPQDTRSAAMIRENAPTGTSTAAKKSPSSPEEEEEVEDGEGAWIGPENIDQVSASWPDDMHHASAVSASNGSDASQTTVVALSLMSTDLAVQNVAARLGVGLAALDGRRLQRRPRTHIRVCSACNHRVYDTVANERDHLFCGECGNYGTLVKCVAVPKSRPQPTTAAAAAVGTTEYQIRVPRSKRQDGGIRTSLRGTIYSIPPPRGGRASLTADLILRPDEYEEKRKRWLRQQRRRGNRGRAAADVRPALDVEQPYGSAMAAQPPAALQVAGALRHNPNEARRRDAR